MSTQLGRGSGAASLNSCSFRWFSGSRMQSSKSMSTKSGTSAASSSASRSRGHGKRSALQVRGQTAHSDHSPFERASCDAASWSDRTCMNTSVCHVNPADRPIVACGVGRTDAPLAVQLDEVPHRLQPHTAGSPGLAEGAVDGRVWQVAGQVVVALPMVDLSSGNDSDLGGGDLEGEDGDEDAIAPGRPKKAGG
eukprot:CAMPEP_0177329322 /NCGR_PEP_ID=MMETSP0368-20130122/19913_1 /TAXON_ID=447022 ORGANISM="Scrippsiella hangoei-like, Strain SHHI-4" /NCGR_SAMPLE_ID=MMETSP0368 /ASSEMBLY_ACC=CAM_ASM_000363 /LENGTH=193 /DNA_ID=CAMNT_0018789545 /DNA_START=48 /DNA_END=627 /DNA_ORIENTATION=-